MPPADLLLRTAHRPAPGDLTGLNLPRWHAERPELLSSALTLAHIVAPHLDCLARTLLTKMPRRPLQSMSIRTVAPAKSKSASTCLLDEAVTSGWIGINSITYVNALLFDIDHPDSIEHVQALPESIRPTLVIDPWSGHAHGILPLNTPVLVAENGSFKARSMMDRAHGLLAAALNATAMPHRNMVKSPWATPDGIIAPLDRSGREKLPMLWEAHEEAATGLLFHTVPGSTGAELRDIVSALVDSYDVQHRPVVRRAQRADAVEGEGRNCQLFDALRLWSYAARETDANAIHARAQVLNLRFHCPLPPKEVAWTARSVARFMNTRYRPGKQEVTSGRGVMRLGRLASDTSAQERQAMSADRTNAIRRTGTDAAINAALTGWPRDLELTQAALAERAGVGIATIKRRWNAQSGWYHTLTLSGDAQAKPGGGGQPPSSLKSLSIEHNAGVIAHRDDQAAIAEYNRITAWNKRPGALPDLPDRPEAGASRDCRRAYAAAQAAYQDAVRRADNRAAKVSKAASREALVDAGRRGDTAYRDDQLIGLSMLWGARTKEREDAGWSSDALEKLEIARRGAFKRLWSAWREGAGTQPTYAEGVFNNLNDGKDMPY